MRRALGVGRRAARQSVALVSSFAAAALALVAVATGASAAPGYRLVGWNDLGMHCVDGNDYAVFSILPPYNNVHAQLIDSSGKLVRSTTGIAVTYEAVADASGSVNTTSAGKTNFWKYVAALFGVSPAPDVGLAGNAMPGASNTPRPMKWDAASASFVAEGVPITPYDDRGTKSFYPMMRLVARQGSTVLATTDVVLPVSDEMDCRACHASGSGTAAQPAAGWVWNSDSTRDYKLNVLRLHDERQTGSPAFSSALATAGYASTGLYDTVVRNATPVLCARCHLSNALPGTGISGLPALTAAIHGRHAGVVDPGNGLPLDAVANRTACYRCHPGSETKCLRGVMGASVAADGSLAMQCQSCHGGMSAVGRAARTGWLQQPSCQQCHTGTAVSNNGQIRYTSVFDASGTPRVAVNATYATNPNVPAAGFSLYRFSSGHGGLQCEACHGSTHAEYRSVEPNDNVQGIAAQGHAGMLSECTACHASSPSTTNGGPHGMHPVGQPWVQAHSDAAENGGSAACQACHGADARGTVLSRALGDRTLTTKFGTKTFWRGFTVSCYACHDGPSSESASSNRPPTASNASASTTDGTPVAIPLAASDPDGNALTLRVVGQPANGRAGLAGTQATYFPDPGFVGTDRFTFAAWDGATDSNLATVTVAVAQGAAATHAWLLPSSARAPGRNGAFFTTDLTVANRGTASATATLKFLGHDMDGRTGPEATLAVPPGQFRTVTDILATLFHATVDWGAVRVTSPSVSLVVVGLTSTAGCGGLFGQSVPSFAEADLIPAGSSRALVPVREDGSGRSNLVLANGTEAPLAVDVVALTNTGATVGTKRVTLLPLGMTQLAMADLGVTAALPAAQLVVSTPTPGGLFAAYASVIDNVTNDPRTILPMPTR